MSYDSLAHVVKMGGTVIFFGIFLIVLLYALWPGNKSRFEEAARRPLEDNDTPLKEVSNDH